MSKDSIGAVWPGKPYPQGATWDGQGVNFAVYSRVASAVELCLFDRRRPSREVGRFELPEETDFVWHGYVPGLGPGTPYGFRVHGPFDPRRGLRCNPAKLLLDPYARSLLGQPDWDEPLFGGDLQPDRRDSAPGCPRSLVLNENFDWGDDRPLEVPWRRTVVYEAHVRGLTMRNPDLPRALRGTYAGLGHPAVVRYLRHLGVTAIELLPVHEFTDDGVLRGKGLRNYWGYSTLGFFAPAQRYAACREPGGAVAEFKGMVKALHRAGIEVILDVAFNHSCEGNHLGPTLSFRGIDNGTYYWLVPESPRYYRDYSGVGNSLNLSSPQTVRLVVDSLRYWASEMHVDGFRFDLATTLGRTGEGGFDARASFFQIVNQAPQLSRLKLIAEPWDLGPDGYQVGHFPPPFREWNDRFRITARRFWRGDENLVRELGYRLAGSADLYERAGRRPQASINYVTCHDGFTLHDLVSCSSKHNEANGERNRDGADDNHSWNCGVEGETRDRGINALRERQKRNLLATLLLSQGVPMICAGDERGRTQRGNNNAYCQDNKLSWVDWHLDQRRQRLVEFTARLVQFRNSQPVLQRRRFFQGTHVSDSAFKDLVWFRPDASEMTVEDWRRPLVRSLMFLLGGDAISTLDEYGRRVIGSAVLVLLNAEPGPVGFTLPAASRRRRWRLSFETAEPARPRGLVLAAGSRFELIGRSLAVFEHPLATGS